MFYGREKSMLRIIALCLTLVLCMPVAVFAEPEAEQTDVVEQTTEATPEATPDPVETNNITGWPQGCEVESDTACLLDGETGTVLYNKKMTEKMYPASTTKVMTALIALENSQLTDKVVFTETGVAEAYAGSSNLYTQVGEEFTMEDCLYALLMKSANDFASQIAEAVGGTVQNFTNMMNKKAAQLGCVNTHFNNAHGLPDENHYSCAYDMALILREAAKNPTFCEIMKRQTYSIPATHLTEQRDIASHNALIMPTELRYEDCLGGKTGFTNGAMYTLVAFAQRDGRQVISSTMHASTSAQSFVDARALFEYGFNNFKNEAVDQNMEIKSGGYITLPITASINDVEVTVEENVATDDGEVVRETCTYNGYQVGQTTVTQASYDEALKEEDITEDEKKEGAIAPSLTGSQTTKTESSSFPIATVAIAVLGVLILAGLVLIVIALIRRKHYYD